MEEEEKAEVSGLAGLATDKDVEEGEEARLAKAEAASSSACCCRRRASVPRGNSQVLYAVCSDCGWSHTREKKREEKK